MSWSPKGKPPLRTGIGIDIAGVPKVVHGLFILPSPVEVSPTGAGPVAAGTRITGVISEIDDKQAELNYAGCGRRSDNNAELDMLTKVQNPTAEDWHVQGTRLLKVGFPTSSSRTRWKSC